MATITAVPAYFGTALRNGSSGPDVAMVQTWLNGVRSKWPQLPNLTVDGKYGSGTTRAVAQFQTLTALSADGVVGSSTWNELYTQYAGIHGEGEVYAGIPTRSGDRGAVVKAMQQRLSQLNNVYTGIQELSVDGAFGSGTASALRQFQAQFALSNDAVMGSATFAKMKEAVAAMVAGNPLRVNTHYPGTVLRLGSSGDSVRFVQSYLSAIGGRIPRVTIDGRYGPATRTAVMTFQATNGLTVDGMVGSATWTPLVAAFNNTL